MPPQALSFRRKEFSPLQRSAEERRRNKRYPLPLIGRFMRPDRHEYSCRLIDISVGGAAFSSPVQLEIGEPIIAYIDEIGGLEGAVSRLFEGGFAINLRATRHKREKLAARITWLINRQEIEGLEARAHDRVAPGNSQSSLRLADGVVVKCSLIDVSLSGASVATEVRPSIGSEVVVGKLRARVMRHHERGIGVRFLDIQEPEALRRYFG
ncbi:MAG: PilZ domain-containing protein [Hyphomicrobiaceae bacterium]|nr:PilZ domain-containing protein [Hyphomicrobiaceae bacterium]